MREKILTAMYESVAKQGYDKTSLSYLAQAVSIQKPSLYYYFKSKEEIFLETVAEYYGDFLQLDPKYREQCHNAESFRDYFFHLGMSYLNRFQQDSTMQQFYCEVNLQSLRIPSLIAYFSQYDSRSQEELAQFYAFAQEKGVISSAVEVSTQVNTTLALMIGLSEMILYHMKGDFQAVWKQYVAQLFL